MLKRWGLGVPGRTAGRTAALREPLKRCVLEAFWYFFGVVTLWSKIANFKAGNALKVGFR